MVNKINRMSVSFALMALFALAAPAAALAKSQTDDETTSRKIDVVIALDVSSSMSGLIASAKQRLWDIVNELGQAQPQPVLRMAILSFGNPTYGAGGGYVRLDLPFTTDLDAVNQTLFAFGTNGGDEYVARAVSTAVNDLQWSAEPDSLRILFVAGNEEATQDPRISVQQAAQAANARGIVVNTIYCGSDNDNIAAGWRNVATMTNGLYASIDQHAAAVANIATPMDTKLAKLNQKLNGTYVAFGKSGDRYRNNQVEQDKNAGQMSSTAMASRVVTKAGRLYDAAEWDLVDAVKAGRRLEEVEAEELPEEMQAMDSGAREAFVRQKTEARARLQAEISSLGKERADYIEKQRALKPDSDAKGLDEVIQTGVRTLAKEKGFSFDES